MSKGTNWLEIRAKCPFYRRIEPSDIRLTCEGFCEGSTVSVRFRCKADLNLHFEGWCCKNFEMCELYRALYAGFCEPNFDEPLGDGLLEEKPFDKHSPSGYNSPKDQREGGPQVSAALIAK